MTDRDDHLDVEMLREVVAKRRAFLAALAEQPQYKRDLIDELDASRSTVDRAVAELVDFDLVETADGRYRTTRAGEFALERHDAYRTELRDVAANADVLGALPEEVTLDASVVANADVHLTDHDRQRPLSLVGDAVREATAVDAVLPRLADSRMLDAYRSQGRRPDTSSRIVLSAPLAATLRERFPAHLHDIATADGTRVYNGDLPPLGVVHVQGDVDAVYVVAYADSGGIAAIFEHTTSDAVEWAAERVADHVAAATDCTEDFAQLPDAATDAANAERSDPDDRLPREVESAGFVEVTDALLERRGHAPLLVSWRTGISLGGVTAGHAIPRRRTRDDGTTVDAASELHDRLRDGRDTVVVGEPGSGKSTLCKQVAARWHDHDPVLYRAAAGGDEFDAVVALERHLEARDGHVLVVVEDVVGEDANAALRLAREFAGADDVTFLFDAREREWTQFADRESWRETTGLHEYAVPELTVAECERLLDRASDRVGTEFALDAGELYEAVHDAAGSERGAFYVAIHHVARLADPLGVSGSGPATTLSASARETFDRLRSRGQTALDVGVLVNLLNVCVVPVWPSLVYAAGDEEFVDDALGVLDGVALFGSAAADGLDAVPNTVHETWSFAFLDHVVDQLGEHATQEAVGRGLSAALDLAASPELRDALRTRADGHRPLLDRLDDDGRGWREQFVADIFDGLGNRPRLAPLVGEDVLAEVPEQIQPLRRYRWAGDLALDAGNPERAIDVFERLHEAASARGSVEHEAAAERGLGRAAKQQSRYDDAAARLAAALALAVRGDERELVFECLLQLGSVSEKRGAFDEAEKQYEAAHDYARSLDDEFAEARALHNLGNAAHSRSDFDAAADYARRALDSYQRHDERLWEAKVRSNLGNALTRTGDDDEAEAQYRRALDIDTELGRDPGIAGALTNLGDLERLRGNYEPALTYTERAESLYRRIGDDYRRAICLNNVGIVKKNQGDVEGAREAHEEAYEIREDIGNPHALGMSEHNLAVCALEAGDLEEAAAYLEDSMAHLDEAGNTRSVAVTRTVLADVHQREGRHDAAIEELEIAVEALAACGDTNAMTAALDELVALLVEVGDDAAAHAHAKRARSVAAGEFDGDEQSSPADD
ncbi:tetratricopeptide repeat protein [Halobacterium noricense]|uniref:tetratricopeptide repeat protein n=1 Tax=Halobacterium noricense TaxID=223182 RepID=UPI001E45EA5A|nr:tetratricopeptide repeat protein [Halobacterium noricense]UHH26503.1 tetratricopeptide repeat protein [Halobacterium noricense]